MPGVAVGTFTRFGGSEGLYLCDFDPADGRLTVRDVVGLPDPSYVRVKGNTLYVASHVSTVDGRYGGMITALEFASEGPGERHRIRERNRRVVPNAHPAYLHLDGNGRFLLIASTAGGGVCVFALQADGSLGDCVSVIHHEGRTTDLSRISERTGFPELPSSAPFPHCVVPDLGNRFALVCDVRLNRIFSYAFDATTGALTPAATPWIGAHAGAGPRHLDFHPGGRMVFVVNETDSTVCSYDYDPESGALAMRQCLSTLPAGWSGHNMTSEIHLDSTGSRLYVANRGHDSIAVFTVDETSGLALMQLEPTRGSHPRSFTFTPDGRHLLVANQHSNAVVALRVDPVTGELSYGGVTSEIPAPTCFAFLGDTSSGESS